MLKIIGQRKIVIPHGLILLARLVRDVPLETIDRIVREDRRGRESRARHLRRFSGRRRRFQEKARQAAQRARRKRKTAKIPAKPGRDSSSPAG